MGGDAVCTCDVEWSEGKREADRVEESLLDLARRIYLTEVHGAVEGDVHFPNWNRADWRETERREAVRLLFDGFGDLAIRDRALMERVRDASIELYRQVIVECERLYAEFPNDPTIRYNLAASLMQAVGSVPERCTRCFTRWNARAI